MPKIYLNSKDVKGVDIVKHNGVCYTRTGISTPASRVALTDSADVKLFYTDCDGCLVGETAIAVGGTGTIANTATNMQIRFAGTTEGETGNLVIEDDASGTCSVALSVNSNDQLVFDTAPTGNGPHTFTTIPMTIQYVACNTDKYDITLAGLGSYVLTVDYTGTGGALDAGGAEPNSLEFEQTIDGVELDSLDTDEQAALVESTETAITESTDGISSVTVTLESGSIIIKSIIKWIADQFEAKLAEFETLLANTSTEGWTTKWQTKLTETFTSKELDVTKATNLATQITNPTVTKKYTPGTSGGDTSTPGTSGGDTSTPGTSGGDTSTPGTSGGDTSTPIDTSEDRVHLILNTREPGKTYRKYVIDLLVRDQYTGKQTATAVDNKTVYIDSNAGSIYGQSTFYSDSVMYWKTASTASTELGLGFGTLKIHSIDHYTGDIAYNDVPDDAHTFTSATSAELCFYGWTGTQSLTSIGSSLTDDWSEIRNKCSI